MLEGTFNEKLRKALAEHPALRDWVVIKHCDMFHKGIPDFSISRGRTTVWVEVKMEGKRPEKIQQHYLDKFEGFWIAAELDGKRVSFGGALVSFDEAVTEIAWRCVK